MEAIIVMDDADVYILKNQDEVSSQFEENDVTENELIAFDSYGRLLSDQKICLRPSAESKAHESGLKTLLVDSQGLVDLPERARLEQVLEQLMNDGVRRVDGLAIKFRKQHGL